MPDRGTAGPLEAAAAAAAAGDAHALEAVLAGVRDDVYGLALRMLWHPQDAADATQDILIKVMTRLGTYRGDAALRTWVFRVAANHLLSVRRGRAERQELSFEGFAADLADGLADPPEHSDVDLGLLEEEVKVGCTQAMLACLDRDHRLAFVLGSVFGLPGAAAAAVCDVEPQVYRKRLSRARSVIRHFMQAHCGLVNSDAACSCRRRVTAATRNGRVDPDRLLFATAPRRDLGPAIQEMEDLHATAAVFRSQPAYATPQHVVDSVRAVLASGRFPLVTTTHRAPNR
jgi:RNA polymerase sigma factor (sigma-70 family)